MKIILKRKIKYNKNPSILNKISNLPVVLIVDDNVIINLSNKKMISEILKEYKLDYQIISGGDGYEIFKIAINYEYNYKMIKCIFTDENMENFNGSEGISFIRKLEKLKHFKKTKIISMTCHEEKNILHMIMSSGADCVIPKQISKNSLISNLKKIGFFN